MTTSRQYTSEMAAFSQTFYDYLLLHFAWYVQYGSRQTLLYILREDARKVSVISVERTDNLCTFPRSICKRF